MNKVIVTILLLSGSLMLRAQDLKEIQKFVMLRQYDKGKEAIDKFLSNESNAKKAEAWYYKALIYGAISRDSITPMATGKGMIAESFNAFKKYHELDPKAPLAIEEENSTVYNIYYGYYDFGIKAYNAKNYEDSYSDFKGALEVHDYIYANNLSGPKGMKFNALDTDIVWNIVILGNELKRGNEIFPYHKKIVDNNLTDPKFLEAYEGVVLYYKGVKDKVMFDQYLEKGKKNFPGEQFWEAVDIEFATQGLTNADLFSKYDELTSKYVGSYVLFFNYAVELNRFISADENKNVANIEAYRSKVPELLKKAISISSTPDANMLMASFYYNNSFDYMEAAGKVKGAKPDDVKKKNELIKLSNKSLDDCIPFAEIAIDLYSKLTKLKTTEKTNEKQAYDMLIEIYRVKGDLKKSAEYKTRKDAIK